MMGFYLFFSILKVIVGWLVILMFLLMCCSGFCMLLLR